MLVTDRSTKVFHRKYLKMKISKSEASRQLKNMLLKIKLLFIFILGKPPCRVKEKIYKQTRQTNTHHHPK